MIGRQMGMEMIESHDRIEQMAGQRWDVGRPEAEETITNDGGAMAREIRYRLRCLMDAAPSDATAVFLIRHQCGGGYKAFLKIRSRSGLFVGAGISARLRDVLDEVTAQVHDQLAQWRNQREDFI